MKESFMKMRLRKIVGACLLLLPAFASQAQLTIDECQEKARKNYPLIKQLDLISKSAEYSISNANKAYLPQLSLTAIGAVIINGLPVMVPGGESMDGTFKFIGIGQLSQTIWDGGATRTQKDIIQATTEVDKANIEVALHSVKERVNQTFFGILVMDEQLRVLNVLRENLLRNQSSVQHSVDNGLAFTSDVDEVKVEILKIDQRKDEFVFTRKAYLTMLGLLTGEALNENTGLVKPALAETATSDIRRPEMSLYAFQRAVAEQQNKMSKVNLMPKIGLLAFGVTIQPGAEFGLSQLSSLSLAGVSASWSTGGLYRDKNIKEQTRINLERIQNQQETFLFNTNLQATQQTHEVEKQRSILMKDDEILSLRASVRKAYEEKYKNGVCSVNDLIRVTNAESESAGNKALHEVQLMMSFYNYKTTTGN